MGERFRPVPDEARDFKADKEKTPDPGDHTKLRIQEGPDADQPQPEAAGERIHWRAPDGNLITPEKEELYRSSETLPEKEPGYGPKASHSDDPGKTAVDDQAIDDQNET